MFATTQAAEPIPFGGREIPVAEAEVRRRHRRHDRDDLRQVGRDGLGVSARVDPGQAVPPRQDVDDDAGAALGVGRRPANAVAADDGQPPALEPAVHAVAGIVRDSGVATVARDDAA